MVDYTQNPFFANPYIERTADNLIRAFRPDSRDAVNRAQADRIQIENEKTRGELSARERLAGTVETLDTTAPITAQWARTAYANGVRAGINPDVVSSTVLGVMSNAGAPDPVVARAFVGTGRSVGKDQGFSIADREGIAKRENDAAFGRTKYSADSSAGATITANRERLAFEKDNPTYDRVKGGALNKYLSENPNSTAALFLQPHNVPAGGQTNYAPGDPRATGPVVEGPAKADKFVVTPDPSSPSGNSYQPVRPDLPAPATKEAQPHMVTPKEIDDLEFNVLSQIPGAWDANKKSVDQRFNAEFGPQMQSARLKASAELQKTRDAARAMQVYMEELGIAPGSEVQQPGFISRNFGDGKVTVKPPPGKAVDAPPAGSLKEGVETTFGNGQVWTLQGGKPQRVR